MKPNILKWLVLFLGFLLIVNPIFSQSKFELSAGIGGPEFFNGKAKYGQNLQVGICVGGFAGNGFFGSKEIFVQGSIAAEVSYHFSGKSKYTEQPHEPISHFKRTVSMKTHIPGHILHK